MPKEYADAEITSPFGGHCLTIKYVGCGAKIESATINGKSLRVSEDDRSVIIDKSEIICDTIVSVKLK